MAWDRWDQELIINVSLWKLTRVHQRTLLNLSVWSADEGSLGYVLSSEGREFAETVLDPVKQV